METEPYSDYVVYEIDAYYDESPYGPDRCPMCAGNLTQSEIEPSRAMYNKLWDPTRERYRLFVCTHGSFRYTCNECHWWCIREACEWIDSPEHPIKGHFDYLIFALTEKNGQIGLKNTSKGNQPWLKTLDDPDVYDRDVVRDLPKGLATLLYKSSASSENTAIHPRGIRDLAEYDPFINKTRDLIAKKRERKLRKTEPVGLHPGETVRIIEQTFGHRPECFYDIVIARWNIGTVVSSDEFLKSWSRITYADEKGWINDGVHYPIRLITAIPPVTVECAFWETLHEPPHIQGVDCKVGEIWLVDANFIERIGKDE